MKVKVTSIPPTFAPRVITLTIESQGQLNALHRMARTGLAKERSAAGQNRSSTMSPSEMLHAYSQGYGTTEGIEAAGMFLAAVSEAGGK